MLKRICRLLLPDERKMGIRVVCAVFLCALLNFAGLAALLPVLFFLLDDGRDKDATLLFCLVAIVFILVKNALVAGLSRFQNHFLMSLYRRLSFSLFTSYYQRGLLFIRSRGSIRLGYEVNYICYAFSLNLLSPLLRMTGELLLILWVTAALLVYAPLTVLMLYITFLPFMLIYGWGIRKPMRRYGEQEQQARREQSRLVTETMKGYAELELNAAFPFFQQAFAERIRKISESRLKLEIGDEVDAGRQHLEFAVQVKHHGDAHAVHVEDRRRPTRIVALATLQGDACARGHHATILKHHVVKQGLALKRNRRGHDADHVELLDALGNARQAHQHIVLKVGSAHQAAGQSTHKERSRDAQYARPALVGQTGLILDATADTLNITQAHIDLCKCELHGPALPIVTVVVVVKAPAA